MCNMAFGAITPIPTCPLSMIIASVWLLPKIRVGEGVFEHAIQHVSSRIGISSETSAEKSNSDDDVVDARFMTTEVFEPTISMDGSSQDDVNPDPHMLRN